MTTSYDTFSPPIAPSMQGTDVTENIRMIENKFGDGYVATTPDGFNYLFNTVNLSWASLDYSSLETILGFFRGHMAVPFLYTLPDESTPRLWYIPPGGWKRAWVGSTTYTLDVQLIERFDAAP